MPSTCNGDSLAGEGGSVERLTDRGFIGVLRFLNGLEVALLAAAHETLGVGLEQVPALPDGKGLVLSDGMIERGLGNPAEEPGELIDNFAGGGEDLEALFAIAIGIAHEIAIAFMAKPLDDAGVPGELDDFKEAVEGIAAPASGIRLLLGPLVDKGKGHAQFRRDHFRARVLKGMLEDFVRFHACILG